MKQEIIFSKDELIWMLSGGTVKSSIAGSVHEFKMSKEEGDKNGSAETRTGRGNSED